MLRLLLRRAHTGRSAAASTLHSDASSAAASLSLRSSVLSSAASASIRRPTSALLSASSLSSSLLHCARWSSLLSAPLAVRPLRSLHCSSQTRGQTGSDSGGDGTSQRKQERPKSEQRGSQSKDDQPRKAQRKNSNNGAIKGKQDTAVVDSAASSAASKADRSAAPIAASKASPFSSPGTLAGTATVARPFDFARSGQSRGLRSAYSDLVQLGVGYSNTFPAKARRIAGSMIDITRKTEWQAMRSQAKQLLASLFQSSVASVTDRLSIAQCQQMLHLCRNLRLVEEPLLVLCAMLDNGKRIPGKCVSMLLECVVKSPQWAAQSGDTAPRGDHPALSALCASRPAPSADLRGVDLAEWMLEEMLSPTLRNRFEIDAFVWTAVLTGLIHEAHRDPLRFQRARAFYERIPNKSPVTHRTMIDAYKKAGMHAEHEALWQLADPVARASPEFTSARLAMIHEKLNTPQRRANLAAGRTSKLTAEESELFKEAERLWSVAKEKPPERMDVVVTGAMLKVLTLLGDIRLLLAVIREAIAAEQAQPLVLVDPACYGHLFDSMSESADPALWMAPAAAAWNQMQQRHADAEKRNLHEHAKLLRVAEATLSAYARYLQLTQRRDELERLWLSAPCHLRDGNEQFFLARLKVLAKDGDAAAAERIIDEMPSFNVQPHVQHFTAWLGCYKQSKLEGRCAEAERVWQRMLDSGVTPASFCYRELMQVYMHDASPAQVAKIDRLHAEMLRVIPAGMSAGDHQHLIKRAYACRLPSEARKWSERAKAAGLWGALDIGTRDIVGRIDQWKNLPRDSMSDSK